MNTPTAPEGTALLKVTEAATELRVSRATMYRLINSGAMPTVHVGSSARIERTALTAYIANRRAA